MPLTTKNEAHRMELAAKVEGRLQYISDLEAWHKKQNEQQAELESSFDINGIQSWHVNIWDDYPEGGLTYGYVEMGAVPERLCLEILLHLMSYARNNIVINKSGSAISLRFMDSSTVYPGLIGVESAEYCLSKRWEITISGASHETLETIVTELEKAPRYLGKPFNIYSES